MLLDTGADVSLIPTKSIESLDFSLGESMKLIGFDGNETSFQSVEAQIIFEGKRFTGTYFLIDQEYGILGRDILNSFTLIFDGVELNWSVISQS
jgi:predicted aspartyl protease